MIGRKKKTQGEGDIRRTMVSTSIAENGHEVDPNSDEARMLIAMLDGMGSTRSPIRY